MSDPALLATPARVALAGLGLATLAMLPRPAWRAGRLAVTAVHEIGHAVAVVVAGGRVGAIHLRADASGSTWHQGDLGWLARVVSAAAGYPAPGGLALVGAALVGGGLATAWLFVLLAVAVTSALLWVRNAFGIVVTAAAVAGLAAVVMLVPGRYDPPAGAFAVWYLAIGGLRAAAESHRSHRARSQELRRSGRRARAARSGDPSDAAEVARLTHLPAGLWSAAFVVVALGAVGGCAVLLAPLG
ncbi:MAG: M50 family metallopeptidase [Acidimicrobiales bacterium]